MIYASGIDNKENLSIRILLTINAVLKDLEIKLTDITKILYTNGPGSYTGIRIGQSVFQALGHALDAQVFNLTVFEALMSEADRAGVYGVAMSAGREDIYVQNFIREKNKITSISKIDNLKISEFENYLSKSDIENVIVSNELVLKPGTLGKRIIIASDNVSRLSKLYYSDHLTEKIWLEHPPVYGRDFGITN